MSEGRRSKLYNYLVNTFKISQESIEKAVNERVDYLFRKHIEHLIKTKALSVENAIASAIARVIEEGTIDKSFYFRKTFDDLVEERLQKALNERLKSDYEITLKAVAVGEPKQNPAKRQVGQVV